jgi:hypothetical protein
MAEFLDAKGASSKEQLIRTFDAAHERLLVAATAAFERGVDIQEGKWGPREVLAHIAGWAVEATVSISQVIEGLPPVVYVNEAQHSARDDAFNAAIITMIGSQSFNQVSVILQQTHQRFVHMLQAQDECIFVPGNYVYERIQAVIRHHLQHARELDE